MTELTNSSQNVGVVEATQICPEFANIKQQILSSKIKIYIFMSFYAYDLQKLVHPLPPPLKSIDWKGLKSKYVCTA